MKSVDSLRLAINEPTETRAPSLLQKIVLWITLVSCTVQPVLAASPIVADPNAGSKKPGVEAALNGVPVVQIVAPNSNGVSHNQYQQFNVESRGAILNNSQGIVQTQQGGYIAGNPNLTGGTARIILNEVTSSNPSLLQGHVEVAGTRAEVVLANPNGITCNGCGFINTSRGVLTTGTPVFGGDGSLNAYRVTGGQIRIDNAGLYGSSTDQLDLIARSVAVNGQLWANQLNVIAGANQVNHANLSTQQIAGMGNAPSVSIDVGALGGMYANKIRLVGTEAGVGVVNAGTLSAQNGDFSIDSQGRITLTGNTSATGVLQLTARDGVSHGGTTYGQQGVQVTTPGDVQNTGTLAAGSDLSIQAASVQSSGVLGGGVQPDSTVGNSGNLTVTTSGQLTANGQNVAGGHISLTAAGINLANSQTSANGNVQLAAQSGDLDLSGSRTSAGGDLMLNATGAVNNDNGQTQAGRITVDAASLSNRSGTLSQSGTADTRITVTGALDNTAGTLASNGNNLTVQAGSLTNSQGQIAHAGTGQLTVTTGALQNDQGLIAGNGQVAVAATSLDNRSGQVLAAGNANLQVSGPVDNRQGQLKSYGGDLTLSTQGALNNATGRIEANGTTSAMTVSAGDIDNTGGRIANIGTRKTTINSSQGIANSNAGNVNGMGMIGGNGELEVNAGTLTNTQNGQIVSGDRMTLNLSGAAQNSGNITATGPLSLTSASLDNSAGEIGTQQGSGSDLRLQTGTLTNNAGKIGSDRNITLSADTVTGAGQIIAAQDVSLNVAGNFTNGTGNQIKANRDMTLTAGGTLTNRGQLEAVNNLNLNATHIDNQAGAGINANQTTLAASGNLTNAGRIEGNTVNAGAASLTNTGTVIGGDVTVTANTLTNDGATALIASTGNTKLWVRDTLTNQNGATVYSMGDLSIAASSQRDSNGRLQDRTATILNDSSTLETDGNLEVAVTNLTNRRAVQIGTTDLGTVAANKSNVILWEWGCTRDENGLQDCTNPWVNRQLNIRGQYTAPKVVTIDASNLNTNDTTNKVLTLKTPLFFGDYQFHLFSDDNSTPQTKPWEWYAGTIYYESLTPINNGTQYQLSFYPGMGPNMMRPSEIRSAGLTDRGELWEAWRRQQVRTQEEQVTQQGADSRILAGNNIKVSLGGTLTNEQGQIAAGANVDINGSTTASGDVTGGNVVNVARGLVRTTTTSGTSGYWTWAGNVPRYAERTDPLSTQTAVTSTVSGSITAGQSININTASVNNQTVFSANVPAGGNGGTLDAGQNHGAPNGGVTSAASQSVPAFNLPQNALYTRHTEPGARYLIETDPRFANFGNFISSDYMLSRLNLNPEQTQKRLGDGFYEQRLVLDQIAQLTGRRTLGQYASAEDQFKALMDQGVAMAQQYNLTPGISLSAAQVAALTSDIVWMESRSVTLPDGSRQQVLTPVVYLARVHADDLKPNGALIAADDLTLQTSGTLTNSGTLRGNTLTLQGNDVINRGGNIDGSTQTLIVANQDIVNDSGTVNGGRVALLAGRDLLNTTQAIQLVDANGSNTLLGSRGNLASRSDLVIQTGRDLTINGANVNATGDATLVAGRNLDVGALETRASATGGREGLSSSVTRTVNATSSLNANNLTLQSNGDTTLKGAALNATDSLTLQAQGDIKLQAVKDDQTQSYQTAGSNYRYGGTRRDETVVGSQLNAGNAIHLSAGPSGEGAGPTPSGNLLLESATVTSGNGQIALNAGNNITVAETAERHESTYHLQESKKGFLNSKTTTLQDQSNGTTAVGSTISGNSIALTTGNDLTVRGSNVVGTQDVQLNAGNNVTIQAATNTYSESHVKDVKESGLLGNGGGVGFMIGSRQQTDNNQNAQISHTASLVGSEQGNVTIQSGKDTRISGSNITAGVGNVAITGRNVDIVPEANTLSSDEQHLFKQAGLTVSVSGTGVLGTVQQAASLAKQTRENKDSRAKALNAIATTRAGYDAYQSINAPKVDADGKPTASAPGIQVSVSVGASRNESTSQLRSSTVQGSNISAGQSVSIVATGERDENGQLKADTGNVTLAGSNVNARDVTLDAANKINLLAARNTEQTHSDNKSSSASVGVAFSVGGQGGFGLSFTANAAMGKGYSDGKTVTQTESLITGSNSVALQSGGDTNVIGSQVRGERITADVGGDLNLQSLQDTQTFTQRQQNMSAGVSIPIYGGSFSASASYQQQKGDAQYASVNEQAGLFAGGQGYQVNVKGNTDLKGSVIDSTASADKNSLTTGTLTSSDIHNNASYSASTVGISAGMGSSFIPLPKPDIPQNESGSDSSLTRSAIANGTVKITDSSGQQQKTGQTAEQTVASLNRDTANANRVLSKNPNVGEILSGQQEVAAALNNAGSAIFKTVGDIAQNRQEDAAKRVAAAESKLKTDPQDATAQAELKEAQTDLKNWSEGGAYKVALHAAGGAITGNVVGAISAGVNEAALPVMREAIDKQLPIPDSATKEEAAAIQQKRDDLLKLASTTLGAATGGAAGANIAQTATTYNYLNHPDRMRYLNAKLACIKSGLRCSEASDLENLSQTRNDALKKACTDRNSTACANEMAQAESALRDQLDSKNNAEYAVWLRKNASVFTGENTYTDPNLLKNIITHTTPVDLYWKTLCSQGGAGDCGLGTMGKLLLDGKLDSASRLFAMQQAGSILGQNAGILTRVGETAKGMPSLMYDATLFGQIDRLVTTYNELQNSSGAEYLAKKWEVANQLASMAKAYGSKVYKSAVGDEWNYYDVLDNSYTKGKLLFDSASVITLIGDGAKLIQAARSVRAAELASTARQVKQVVVADLTKTATTARAAEPVATAPNAVVSPRPATLVTPPAEKFILTPQQENTLALGKGPLQPEVVANTGASASGEVLTGGPRLLPTEGNVGTYRDLIKAGSVGDNITPNHIPSANRMAREGVSKGDGIAINMEQPVPGVGGRHRATFTYGTQADINMTPRDALAAGVWDARAIYRADGLYTPQIRSGLQDLIRMNKTNHPTIFVK